jgi:CHASE3 domain sensor protein
MIRTKENDTMRAAQEIIQSLQRQLDKKNSLVERYRDMIKDIRNEVSAREDVRVKSNNIII